MLFTDVLLAFTLWVSSTFERKGTCSFLNPWMCSAGSCCWNGECNTQYGRQATSKDPTGKFWKQLVACPQQAAETNTKHQKMHRKKDFPKASWEHLKLELRKWQKITANCWTGKKHWRRETALQRYNRQQLYSCAVILQSLPSSSLFNIYVGW